MVPTIRQLGKINLIKLPDFTLQYTWTGSLKLRVGYSHWTNLGMLLNGLRFKQHAEEVRHTAFSWQKRSNQSARKKANARRLPPGRTVLAVSLWEMANLDSKPITRRGTKHTAVCSSASGTTGRTGHPECLIRYEWYINWAITHRFPVGYVNRRPSPTDFDVKPFGRRLGTGSPKSNPTSVWATG